MLISNMLRRCILFRRSKSAAIDRFNQCFLRFCSKHAFATENNEKASSVVCHHTASCAYAYRTFNCGQINQQHIGQHVKVCGWLRHKRIPKFLLIDDVYGSVQIFNDKKDADLLRTIKNLHLESVLEVDGVVVPRPPKDVNPQMSSGHVEVRLEQLNVLNPAKHPFPVDVNDFVSPNQLNRMKYRYLDLRRPTMQNALRFRAKLISKMRLFLESQDFVEVETPTLFRRTPGGAREFIVPSSAVPGKFYSLPQSPQQFKQLLMVAGLDRYYQIARCYRDEGSKSDRQPEFTQLDIELSFTDQNKVMLLIEDVIKASWFDELAAQYSLPVFRHMTYQDAMLNYGTDKPDLRYDWSIKTTPKTINTAKSITDANTLIYLEVFDGKCSITQEVVDIWRHQLLNQYPDCVNDFGCYRHMGHKRFEEIGTSRALDLRDFDLNVSSDHNLIFAIGSPVATCSQRSAIFNELKTLGLLRIWAADFVEEHGVPVRRDEVNFLWVTDFPLFLPAEDSSKARWESAHHPFTAPQNETMESLRSKNPGDLIGQHYDLVLNGTELGGGSIRIHNAQMQQYVLDEILNENCAEMKHLLEALEYGAPPHGGFAIGLDRYIALLLKKPSIRDVIAFPKVTDGRDLMTQAPAEVCKETLDTYHVQVKEDCPIKTEAANCEDTDKKFISDSLMTQSLIN